MSMRIVAVLVCMGTAMAARPAGAQAPQTLLVPQQGARTVAAAAPQTYRLAAGDGIEVRFFHNPELNEQVQIRPDGGISMQAIGDVKVSGLTVTSVAARLADAYRDVLRDPAITVQVRTFANNRIFVGGEVARPGMLPLVGEQTALGAITEAGGVKASAKRNEVLVVRRGENEMPQVLKLSMRPRGAEPSDAASFSLAPLDVVLVPESGIARANRGIDQYVRQMIPGVLTGGFSYLFNGGLVGLR
jgi:protein involved in polysaccharide export with SLBB domain